MAAHRLLTYCFAILYSVEHEQLGCAAPARSLWGRDEVPSVCGGKIGMERDALGFVADGCGGSRLRIGRCAERCVGCDDCVVREISSWGGCSEQDCGCEQRHAKAKAGGVQMFSPERDHCCGQKDWQDWEQAFGHHVFSGISLKFRMEEPCVPGGFCTAVHGRWQYRQDCRKVFREFR